VADALDVIRACQCVIVWRRQTLIDENRKASRNIETRSQASGRAAAQDRHREQTGDDDDRSTCRK